MKFRNFKLLLIAGLLFCLPLNILAEGSAGTVSLFHSLGAGARQLGLGGACVAMPFDATTIYWNPAAIDYLEHKSASFFYTNLLGGASYNYFGYVHPTIGIGTFGLGILRVGVGGVEERGPDSPYKMGEFEYSSNEFLFSYGKQFLSDNNLSFGANIKIEQQSFPGLSYKANDTGVGGDIGLFYRPQLYGAFEGLSVGFLMQNILAPRLKPGDVTDELPRQFKLGVAKAIRLSATGNRMLVMMDVNKAELNPVSFHVGGEYIYNNMAMIRFGFNNQNRGSNFVFGAGATYNMFQIDYSFAPIDVADYSSSHRISLTVNFGKSKTELIELAQQRRMLEIQEEMENELKMRRESEKRERLADARRYFEEGDYIQAEIEFSAVLKLDQDNQEALEKIEIARQKREEAQNKLMRQRIEQDRLKEEQIETEAFIRNHWQKGIAYYERGQYQNAIDEWNLILSKDPNYELAIEWRDRALTDLRNEVKSMIKQADIHAANHRYMEAVRILDKAKQLNSPEMQLDDEIDSKSRRYMKAFNSEQLYRRGLQAYDNKNYAEAAQMFEKALSVEPNNRVIQELYQNAKARATAENKPLPPRLKQKYFTALELYNDGQYEEALKIFEEILQVQPNNKRVLTTLDNTREKLEKTRRQKSSGNNR